MRNIRGLLRAIGAWGLLVAVGACNEENQGEGGDDGSAGAFGDPAADDDGSGAVDETPLRGCGDRELIVAKSLVHNFTSDSQDFYWFSVSDASGDIEIRAMPKSGGEPRVVTAIPNVFAYTLEQTDLAVSADSQLYLSDLLADDDDDYLYFSGDTQAWRVRKDGGEPVQAVSGSAISELGATTCNLTPNQLTPQSLFSCRSGRIFRMTRTENAAPEVVYEAPDGEPVRAWAANDTSVFVNGPYDDSRFGAPLLRVAVDTGEVEEFGGVLEGLVPDGCLLKDQTLVYSTTVESTDYSDLDRWNAWYDTSGSYRIGLEEAAPTRISSFGFTMVRGASMTGQEVYSQVGDQAIYRIGLDGTTRLFVDCEQDASGTEEDFRFDQPYVDETGVYVRSDDEIYRFAF